MVDKETHGKFAILPHMGLGDAFVQKGLVATIASHADDVVLIGKKRYEESLFAIYDDIENLSVVFVDDDKDISPAFGADGRAWRALEKQGYAMIPLGFHTGNDDWLKKDTMWSRCLYKQLGIQPSAMYSKFGKIAINEVKAADMLEKVVTDVGCTYVVVHDDPGRDMKIDESWLPAGIPVVHVDDPRIKSDVITDYLTLIENATEFHGIDSCFALMADLCIENWRGPKRVVHTTPGRPYTHPGFYRGTTVIDHGFAARGIEEKEGGIAPDGTRFA